MDQLDSNSVPFPFGRVIFERNPGIVQGMSEHEGSEYRDILGGRLWPLAFTPFEQLAIRGLQPMPHLLDLLHIEPKGVGQRLFGEPRRDADAKCASRELEQCEPARGIEMI